MATFLTILPAVNAATVAKMGVGTVGAGAILLSSGCDEYFVEVIHTVGAPIYWATDYYYDDYYYDDDYYYEDEVWVEGGYYYDDCFDPWCKGQASQPAPGHHK